MSRSSRSFAGSPKKPTWLLDAPCPTLRRAAESYERRRAHYTPPFRLTTEPFLPNR